MEIPITIGLKTNRDTAMQRKFIPSWLVKTGAPANEKRDSSYKLRFLLNKSWVDNFRLPVIWQN
jgi:hypothetical protein